MIRPNQIVHLSFVKNRNGVVLNCFDPYNRNTQYWQFIEKRVDRNVPIVISRRAIFYDDTSHVLFAAGRKIFIVTLQLENSLYTAVESVSVITTDVIDPETWITSILGHQPTANPCDEFIFTVSFVTKMFVFSVSGEVKQIVETRDSGLSNIELFRVAFCEKDFAIIDRSRGNVILILY